jgi:hypothetical protein
VFWRGDFSKKEEKKDFLSGPCVNLCVKAAFHGGDFLPPCEINSLDNMLNLKQFLRNAYT